MELIKHYSVLELPSVAIEITKNDHHIISGYVNQRPLCCCIIMVNTSPLPRAVHCSKILGGNFERLSLPTSQPSCRGAWLPRGKEMMDCLRSTYEPSSTNPAPLAPSHPPSESLKKERNAFQVFQRFFCLSRRVSSADVLGAISYALRVEVAIHSIVSGHEFTALLRFTHLLESVIMSPHKCTPLQQYYLPSCPSLPPSLSPSLPSYLPPSLLRPSPWRCLQPPATCNRCVSNWS